MQRFVPANITTGYRSAREDAGDETGLPLATFPETCPWTPQEILDDAFWPDPPTPDDEQGLPK